MNYAIYARKSTYSDKSDSIDNQVRLCRDYVKMKYDDKGTITVYCDEGLTGANTNRPALKRLLNDIDNGIIDVLVTYQLDRLSRDVRDFSNIYGTLEENRVKFVSLKENIDTNTPIGKAMTYITMVFAQLERESIAARVTDNMIGLAKKGLWTGGNPPYGYIREKIVIDGKRHVSIKVDPEAAEWVHGIFQDFLNNNYSLQRMETAYKHKGIKTPNGSFFSTTQLHKILTMPYCVEATPEVFDFYNSLGCKMESPREMWDGSCGVMIYGRTSAKNKRHQIKPQEEWIVCVGLQKPFIKAEEWLEVQGRFARNKIERKKKYDIPLLKGSLRCGKCGCLMQVSRKKTKRGVHSAYYCLTRMRKGISACDVGQVDIRRLDSNVLKIFSEIKADPDVIMKYASADNERSKTRSVNYAAKIASLSAQIRRLTHSLAESEDSAACKYIVAEIEHIDSSIQALRREQSLNDSEKKRVVRNKLTIEKKVEKIKAMLAGMSKFSASEKNEIVRSVVKEMTWDGESLFLKL